MIEWAKARFGRFALANAVGQRAKQLIVVWGGHWKPNGGGLLNQALSDITEERAKIMALAAGSAAPNHHTDGGDVKC